MADKKYSVILEKVGNQPLMTTKILCGELGLGLAMAKGMVDKVPSTIATDLESAKALELKKKLEEVGNTVSIPGLKIEAEPTAKKNVKSSAVSSDDAFAAIFGGSTTPKTTTVKKQSTSAATPKTTVAKAEPKKTTSKAPAASSDSFDSLFGGAAPKKETKTQPKASVAKTMRKEYSNGSYEGEMKDGEPMRVCVERYGFLPTDGAAFKGGIPEIKNMVPFEPFDFYIKRKLYIHNMGHATCAYLGDLLDLEYIYQAIDVADVRIIVQNAMLESAQALSQTYGVELGSIVCHIEDLLYRFTNKALKDTCARVGGDPARKLSPDDRLIGSSVLAQKTGIVPSYIAIGAAAGLRRLVAENDLEQSMENGKSMLLQTAGLTAGSSLTDLILKYYQILLESGSINHLRKTAEETKLSQSRNII